MTLEEIRILARDMEDAEGDSARNRMGGAEKQELAALLVRAVEALAETMTAEPQTRLCYSKTCPGREFPCSVVDDSRSLLRALEVEA